MSRIITPTQLQTSVVKIIYKEENGTGFFISNNIILTAYHIFLDDNIENNDIKVYLIDNFEVKCKVLFVSEEYDICLLECMDNNSSYLPITQTLIKIEENWESYGYPYESESNGLRINGKINQIVKEEKYDFILNCKDLDSDFDYGGMSGAPIVSMGRVIGVVLRQLDDKLGVISIAKIASLLKAYPIRIYKEELANEIPSQLQEDITDIISNYNVINSLDNLIQKDGNWILIEGKPGTGKTVNVASFIPDSNCIVLGKYFTKIPNDDKSKAIRESNSHFLNWLEETISIILTGDLPAKSNETLEVRLKNLDGFFDSLQIYLERNDRIGILFIDGLDEISDLKGFLSVFPDILPQRLRIVLSCTTRAILPSFIKKQISDNRIILVSSLDQSLCEYFIQRKLDSLDIDYDSIQKIALKSEGHPLYLHYLIDYILKSDLIIDGEKLNIWIDSIPTISGNIENYYDNIWEDIYEDVNKLWICLILSQLRHSVSQNDLIYMLPDSTRMSYYSVLPKIDHLIKGTETKEIYHNSFKDYILKKVPLFITDCNDLIVKFCEQNPNNIYSITNLIYHYTLSKTPSNAIYKCNQDWADNLALNHIEPDLILFDIKSSIELSIDLEEVTELLRLLLLLQRIDFRYNSVFVEYAYEIALSLIGNGNYKQSIKYLVRRNSLLVGIRDSVHFLQHFYENKAYEELEILVEAIDREYRRQLDEEMSKGSLSPNLLIVKAQLILFSEVDVQKAYRNLSDYLNWLDNLKNHDTSNNLQVQYIRDYCYGWLTAFILRCHNHYMDIEIMQKSPQGSFTRSSAGIHAFALLLYNQELNNYNLLAQSKNKEAVKRIVNDIEFLIENYGYIEENHVRKVLIEALINNTSHPEILNEIIIEYIEDCKESLIRKKNGVDFNKLGYDESCIKNKCIGFLDTSDEAKFHHKQWFHNTWEHDLLLLIKEISFFEGKLYSYKATNQINEKKSFIVSNFQKIINSISFSFTQRSHWDRSYQLPEQVFPHVFARLIELLHEFNFENLSEFIDLLINKSSYQLGLYSEGFRSSINEVVKSLIFLRFDKKKINDLVYIWESHVLLGVQNRWERTEELLKINEIYGLLNENNKSQEVFQNILNTSMGPSWYKESQLSLINTILKNLKSVPKNTIQDFASLLDFASGEMTFQRYVKNNKEEFIGNLICNDKVPEALNYYKFEIMPPPDILIRNAEVSNFDATKIGEGYCLGAGNITEANAVLKILQTIDSSWYLKWGLCQIFILNDDVFRYIDYYGDFLAIVLNEIELLQDKNVDSICNISFDLIYSKKISYEDRNSLLHLLFQKLSKSNISRLQSYCLKHGIKCNAQIKKEKITTQERNNFDLFNESLNYNSLISSEAKLIEGIEIFKKERISIWFNNWSHSTDLAKKNIKNLLDNKSLVMKYLKQSVIDCNDEYWIICDELIWFLEGKLNDNEIIDIYQIVNDHFQYIIRPTYEAKEKYSWISDNEMNHLSDNVLCEFIIWHLNHPNSFFNNQAEEVLIHLGSILPLVIEHLFNQCLSDIPESSTERCSIILSIISERNPLIIKTVLMDKPKIIDEILLLSHITILKNLLDISINLNRIGFSNLFEKIQNSIPNTAILLGEVFFEESHLFLMQDVIDGLNSELLLDSEFCLKINKLLNEYCFPLSKEEVIKSDKYLKRSFENDNMTIGRYDYFIRHALNKAIFHRVSKDNIGIIYNYINN